MKIYFNNHWEKDEKLFHFPFISLTYDNCSGVGKIITIALLGFSMVIKQESKK